MATDMTGLFGPSPDEIAAQRQQALLQQAGNYANQTPFQRAAAGMFTAGGMLGGMGAKALGGVSPQEQMAQRTQAIMGEGDMDLTSSKGLLAKADQFRKAGDVRTAMALTLKGKELEKQEQAAALASRKQDFQEQEAMDFKREQLKQQADLKLAQLQQQDKDAERRSQDTRLGIEAQERAKQESNALKLQIAQMTAAMTKMGLDIKAASTATGKPLTPAQQAKLDKEKAASSAAIRSQDAEIQTLGADITKVMNDPNLSRATGMSDYIWSRPGGAASLIEGQLDSIVNKLKAQGLKVLREGGGIGAITEKERDILANQVANIDRKKGPEYVKGELEKVNLTMQQMKRNAAQRHAEQFGEEYSPARDAAPGLPSQEAIAAEIARRRKGK